MKHKSILFIFATIFILVSCKQPEARRPKKHGTTNFYKEIIEKNKKLNALEKQRIEKLLVLDTIHTYKTSANGFWYTYLKKDTLNNSTPKINDLARLSYNISDIQGNVIYEKKEITYKIDKEDFIPALQDGIKLMKKGETITFVIPSYSAFGVTGDGKGIKVNQSIQSTVTLIDIKTNK